MLGGRVATTGKEKYRETNWNCRKKLVDFKKLRGKWLVTCCSWDALGLLVAKAALIAKSLHVLSGLCFLHVPWKFNQLSRLQLPKRFISQGDNGSIDSPNTRRWEDRSGLNKIHLQSKYFTMAVTRTMG